MAKLMKSFIGSIGGMASRLSGSELYDAELDKESQVRESPPLDSKLSLSGSDEDVGLTLGHGGGAASSSCGDEEEVFEAPKLRGSLQKWTNYLHGWQERYFVLADGVLSYYKSEMDTQYGCRGSISLLRVRVLLHEFDELRFDIRGHECTYFLRASSREEKESWVEALESNKKFLQDNGFDATMIRRQGSVLSLSGLSQTSTSSFKVSHDLTTKLAELETYRDILCRQVDLLQAYFESLAETQSSNGNGAENVTNGISHSQESIDDIPEEGPAHRTAPSTPKHAEPRPPSSAHHSPLPSRFTPQAHKGHRRTGSDPFAFRPSTLPMRALGRMHASGGGSGQAVDLNGIDFRGEAITFKATTAGIIASLSHCIETMARREDYWQKKFDKEQERRRKAEVAAHSAINGPRVRAYEYAGPDFEEGPHSALNEEEFFDALEMAYQNDEMEANGQRVDSKEVTEHTEPEPPAEEPVTPSAALPEEITHRSVSGVTHRLTPLINEKTSQYARYIFEPVDSDSWSVVHEEGEMKVYRREMEEDGVVIDPLRATYTAGGITAREVIDFFFDKETRLEWEGTLESVDVVESLAEDSIIFHQLHKRVWPSTQRETLFCSHRCQLTNAPRPENMIGHTWMVCNFSLEHDKVPVTSKLIRATIHVGLVCQTIASKPVEPGKESELTRDDIQCKISYAANVNPGGWAPPSIVRTIGKRELCKFLKKFSSTVQSRLKSNPLTL